MKPMHKVKKAMGLDWVLLQYKTKSGPGSFRMIKLGFPSVIEFIVCMDNSAMYMVHRWEEFKLLYD